MDQETSDKIKAEIVTLDERCIAISKEIEDIESILVDLEALFSKLHKTSLFNLFCRDFLAIKDLYYKEKDKLSDEKRRIIRKRGRISVKRSKYLSDF